MRRLVLVLCTTFALGGLTGCDHASSSRASDPVTTAAGTWERLPDPPLSPRLGPVVAWTGREVLVLGGDPGAPCPIDADCARANPYRSDGAAYDPQTRHWRPIADAPVGAPDLAEHALIDGHLFVSTGSALLDYDVHADRWRRLRPVPKLDWYSLAADRGRLVLYSASDEDGVHPDFTYDVATRRLARLPDDPLGPAFDRSLVSTPVGLVLTAHELVPNPGADGPSVLLGAVLDARTNTWRRLSDSDQLGGGAWSWTGHRLVDPTLGGADGGKVGNYGRTVPYGGTLDPATGRWGRLSAPPPASSSPGWSIDAASGRWVATGGWFYDDRDQTWSRVPRPKGGPEQPGPAVWVGDLLVVVGGIDRQTSRGTPDDLSTHVWRWQPKGLQ